jgi:hypothetical protein
MADKDEKNVTRVKSLILSQLVATLRQRSSEDNGWKQPYGPSGRVWYDASGPAVWSFDPSRRLVIRDACGPLGDLVLRDI